VAAVLVMVAIYMMIKVANRRREEKEKDAELAGKRRWRGIRHTLGTKAQHAPLGKVPGLPRHLSARAMADSFMTLHRRVLAGEQPVPRPPRPPALAYDGRAAARRLIARAAGRGGRGGREAPAGTEPRSWPDVARADTRGRSTAPIALHRRERALW
jgi:hypothetical protein